MMQASMFQTVRVDARDGALVVQFPYDPGAVNLLKARIPAADRKWSPTDRAWLIAPQHAQEVKTLLERAFRVHVELPDMAHAPSGGGPEVRLLDVRYVGTTKERDDGSESAFGWHDGGWSVIFPKASLMTWFGAEQRPGAATTLYSVLGVSQNTGADEIRSAWKRLARQWHPDICREPDAIEQFQALQHAYAVLSDAGRRARYDAGLALQATLSAENSFSRRHAQASYRAPLRCGWILAQGQASLGRFVVERILQWQDIVDAQGRVLVTTWPASADTFSEQWVQS